MASVNWQKMTAAAVSGLYLHLDQHARQTHEHGNKDIRKELTPQNYIIGADSFRDAISRMKKRTKEADAVQPPLRVKKDRVVACMLEYPCPKEIADAGRADEFFKAMYEECRAYFGAENVHASFVHKDEVHTYVDGKSREERESLMHAHTLVSAYTAEKGINGKAFETKQRLNNFNRSVNEMCRRNFGIEYNTHFTPAHKSVEELKAKSREQAALKKAEEAEQRAGEAQRIAQNAHRESTKRLDELNSATAILAAMKRTEPEDLYPPEVEHKTVGFGSKKRDYVLVPKEMWEKRYVSYSDMISLQERIDGVLKAIEQWACSASGKQEKALAAELRALRDDRDELARNAESASSAYDRGYREAYEIFARVLDKLDDRTYKQVKKAIDQVNRELGFGPDKVSEWR